MAAPAINYPTIPDPISFLKTRNDEEQMRTITDEEKGLDTPGLDEALKAQRYVDVLKAIWSEKDLSRRCEWLNAQGYAHTLLIFERAIAIAEKTLPETPDKYPESDESIKETFALEIFPLMNIAIARLHIDVETSDTIIIGEVSDTDVIATAKDVYLKAMDVLIRTRTGKYLGYFFPTDKEMEKAYFESYIEKMQLLYESAFADPKWNLEYVLFNFCSKLKKFDELSDEALSKLSPAKAHEFRGIHVFIMNQVLLSSAIKPTTQRWFIEDGRLTLLSRPESDTAKPEALQEIRISMIKRYIRSAQTELNKQHSSTEE